MNRQMEFELIFRAQAAAAKNATNDLRNDVAALGNEVTKTAAAFDREAAAMNRDTEATRKNTDATNALMQAEAKARQDALEAAGAIPASSPAPGTRRPRRPPTPQSPQPPTLPPSPPEPPSNDNARRDRARRQNLTYQVFDIGQGVAGGMPLTMVAAQQLPQVIQLYSGQGGMNDALKDFRTIAGGASRAITPLTVGMAGLAAVAVTGALAYDGYLRSIKEVDTAASGLGRAVAGSRAEMEAAAQAGAAAAGISVSSARSMEAQFLRTGRIGSENFESLISISKDFGATMGVTTDEAGSMLTEMFADPAKAADTLFQKYGLIDAATARHASNLAAQNRQSEAQAVLLKALPSQLADASEATTALARAWEFVARNASNAFDNVGSFLDRRISGPTLEEQIAEAEAAQKRLSSGFGFLDIFNPANAEANANAARLPELQERKRRQDEDAEKQRKQSEENARSRAAVPLYEASPANARALQEQKLRNDIAAMESARGIGSIDAGQNEAAIEAKKRALDALVNSQSRAIELDRLDIQIANERNPLLRAELEARRVRIQMAAQEKSATEIEAAAALARNHVLEETIASSKAQAADMRAEVETRSRLNSLVASGAVTASDANRMLQEELTLRPLIAAAAMTEGAEKAELERQIAALRDGYSALAQQEKLASAQEYLRGNQEKLQQLRLQQALIGENALVQERANALLEVEQRIRRDGIDTNSSLATAMRDQADAMATLNRQIERQAEAWDTVKSAAGSAIDEGIDKLLDGDFSGALESVADEIKGLFSELAIKNPIKNAFLGGDDPTMADVGGLGGIVSRLFGGKGAADPKSLVSSVMGQSVGTMSVNAATVMINGSVAGGLGGLLGGAANDNSNVIPFPGSISAYAKAIQSIESGGNYSALGPLTASGDRAYGAYQVMGANIPSWTKQALGQSLTPQQFLGNSAAQDAVFEKIFGGYVSKFGASGAAQAWFGGPGSVGSGGAATDILGTSGTAYVQKFNAALGTATQSTNLAAQGLGNLGTGFDKFGNSLSSINLGGSAGGSLFGGFNWSSLFSPSFKETTTLGNFLNFGFDSGGWTGPGETKDVAGVVHADEFVFSKKAVQKIGVPKLDAMHKGLLRGFDGGGYTTGSVFPSSVGANSNVSPPNVSIAVHNYSGQEIQQEESTDSRGNRQLSMTIGQQGATAVHQRGNPLRRSLQSEFGLKPRAIKR